MTNANSRWMHLGYSDAAEPRAATAAAAQQALAEPEPRLLLLVAPSAYPPDEIALGLGDVAADVPVIGTSGYGHIGSGRPPDEGVSVLGLGGDFDVDVAVGVGLSDQPRAVGERVAAGLAPFPDRPHHAVVLLSSPLDGGQQEMIWGAFASLGTSVPLVGGVPGDSLGRDRAWEIGDGVVLRDALVGARISSDAPIGIAVRHGFQTDGDPMITTESDGGLLLALDERPALDAVLEGYDAPPEVYDDPAALNEFLFSRPLAVARRGDAGICAVLRADAKARSILLAAPVPEGAAVWRVHTDVGKTLSAAAEVCVDAVAALGGESPRGLLIVDCSGRRIVLTDDGLADELAAIRGEVGDAPILGLYGNGEIARIRGTRGFHNYTIVACAFA